MPGYWDAGEQNVQRLLLSHRKNTWLFSGVVLFWSPAGLKDITHRYWNPEVLMYVEILQGSLTQKHKQIDVLGCVIWETPGLFLFVYERKNKRKMRGRKEGKEENRLPGISLFLLRSFQERIYSVSFLLRSGRWGIRRGLRDPARGLMGTDRKYSTSVCTMFTLRDRSSLTQL